MTHAAMQANRIFGQIIITKEGGVFCRDDVFFQRYRTVKTLGDGTVESDVTTDEPLYRWDRPPSLYKRILTFLGIGAWL